MNVKCNTWNDYNQILQPHTKLNYHLLLLSIFKVSALNATAFSISELYIFIWLDWATYICVWRTQRPIDYLFFFLVQSKSFDVLYTSTWFNHFDRFNRFIVWLKYILDLLVVRDLLHGGYRWVYPNIKKRTKLASNGAWNGLFGTMESTP